MKIDKVQVSFVGMDPTDALKDYTLSKLGKNERLLEKATAAEIVLTENQPHRGVKKDFEVDFNIKVPNSFIHVDDSGEDMYALIDKATDVLFRRFKRYTDKFKQWSGKKPWKVEYQDKMYFEEKIAEENKKDYNWRDYVPKIVERKKIDSMRPMDEAEAIERMELKGYDKLLFKSKKTGTFAVVYRIINGKYGLVEAENDLE